LKHTAKPIYASHGFSLSFSEADCPHPNWHRHVCLVRHVDGYSETHFLDLPADGIGGKGNAIAGMNPVQGAISSGSYAQRILTARVFDITIADTDLDGASDNPPANPVAPKAEPRGKRTSQPVEELAVTKQQMGHLAAFWKSKNPDPDGDLHRQRTKLADWLVEVSGRGLWNPANPPEWRLDDYIAGCRALNIEPEGVE
jgi:hypothetical protein